MKMSEHLHTTILPDTIDARLVVKRFGISIFAAHKTLARRGFVSTIIKRKRWWIREPAELVSPTIGLFNDDDDKYDPTRDVFDNHENPIHKTDLTSVVVEAVLIDADDHELTHTLSDIGPVFTVITLDGDKYTTHDVEQWHRNHLGYIHECAYIRGDLRRHRLGRFKPDAFLFDMFLRSIKDVAYSFYHLNDRPPTRDELNGLCHLKLSDTEWFDVEFSLKVAGPRPPEVWEQHAETLSEMRLSESPEPVPEHTVPEWFYNYWVVGRLTAKGAADGSWPQDLDLNNHRAKTDAWLLEMIYKLDVLGGWSEFQMADELSTITGCEINVTIVRHYLAGVAEVMSLN